MAQLKMLGEESICLPNYTQVYIKSDYRNHSRFRFTCRSYLYSFAIESINIFIFLKTWFCSCKSTSNWFEFFFKLNFQRERSILSEQFIQ